MQELAPFLSFDDDPYPVALDGRVVWVIDGYTTSGRYPYGAERRLVAAELRQRPRPRTSTTCATASRSSSTRTTAAVTLYVIDEFDPVLQVWQSAFPDLFTAGDEMPEGLVDHLRYPEELFRVQTAAYSKYRLDSADFFDREGAWSVALAAPEQPPVRGNTTTVTTAPVDTVAVEVDAGASSFPVEQKADRFVPYYAMFHPDGDEAAEFSLFRPFQPFSVKNDRRELVAYMTADSERPTHRVQLSSGVLPEGPNVVGANISTDQRVLGARSPCSTGRLRRGLRRPADDPHRRLAAVDAAGLREVAGGRSAAGAPRGRELQRRGRLR